MYMSHRVLAAPAILVVIAAATGCGPNTNSNQRGAAAAAPTPAPTLDNGQPVSPTPLPVVTPLSYPSAAYSNSYIATGLASDGYATYQPPSDETPAISSSQAMQTAQTHNDPLAGVPVSATLVVLQETHSTAAPLLVWVVDCTPTAPETVAGAPSGYAGPTKVQYDYYVEVVDAQQGDSAEGEVLFSDGGAPYLK